MSSNKFSGTSSRNLNQIQTWKSLLHTYLSITVLAMKTPVWFTPLGDALPRCWFHLGSSKWKSTLPVKLGQKSRGKAKHLQLWEHLLTRAGREPDQVKCLGTVSQVHPQQHSRVATRASPTPTPPHLPLSPSYASTSFCTSIHNLDQLFL